jgi:hypothetical protein
LTRSSRREADFVGLFFVGNEISFDELQLVDATSAAMLRDVLSWYWRMGGIIIATSVSPWPPSSI